MHSLRHIIFILGIICLQGLATPSFADQTLAIIVQPASPLKNISLETLKMVFLRKALLDSHNTRWIPVNFPATHPLREAFSLKLFNQLPEEQENYWNEQYFQDIEPPEVFVSEEAIIRFVAMTPGAIGYIPKHTVDARVKTLLILTVPVRK